MTIEMRTAVSDAEATLARWQAEEDAVRARLGEPGVAGAGQVRGRTGLETLQAIFDGELPRPPIGDTLDFLPIHMEHGVAVFQGKPQRRHYNPLGSVRALTDAVALVRAEGKLIHLGRRVATAEARLVGPDGKLYAHATTTCLIFDQP